MSHTSLPERASLEYLMKLAKERLQELRRTDSRAKLAAAQLAVARDHGFSSWRALRDEVERRRATQPKQFFDACERGDVEALRVLLAADAGLVRLTDESRAHAGWTGLHSAAHRGHLEAVRLLLERGADPNAREAGDNTYPLHWAAAAGHLETARALLDRGGDVHGIGDVHELDTLGWATVFREPGTLPGDLLALLVERGARHHIFSALAGGDPTLVRRVVAENPRALDRRLSRFEQGQSALHFAMRRKRYDLLDLLIELGADLEAEDADGQTALSVAMLRGDREAMTRLHAAGAKPPRPAAGADVPSSAAKLAPTVRKGVPALNVPDIGATLEWYTSIGFKELGRFDDGGLVNWGWVSYGKAEIMFGMGKGAGGDVSLWFYMEEVDTLYQLYKSRQLAAAQAALAGEAGPGEIVFEEDLYDPFYGGRQFSIRDLNGYTLIFYAD